MWRQFRETSSDPSGIINAISQVSWSRLYPDGSIYRYDTIDPDLSDPSIKVYLLCWCAFNIHPIQSDVRTKRDNAKLSRTKWIITDFEKWEHVAYAFQIDTVYTRDWLPQELNVADLETLQKAARDILKQEK